MHLDSGAFNQFLADIGQQTEWRQSYACPCRNPNTGAADPRCPSCAGKGYTWVAGRPGVVGMAGQRTQDQWAKSTRWQEGDIVVTIPSDVPMYAIGLMDRVLMMNSQDRFSVVLTRGAPNERFVFTPASIERAYWLDPQTKLPVNAGSLPVVQPDGRLAWMAGPGSPPLGTSYSITGQRRSEYFCFGEMPSNRNMHSGEPLPRKVVLRRWDLFGR